MPTAIENFRMNLASAMERTGITEYALNKATGISRSYIGKVLKDESTPSLEYCEKLAVAVKVPLVFLIMDKVHFERIMSQTVDRIEMTDGDFVQRELLPMLPTSNRLPPAKKKPAAADPESHRRLLWVKKLLAS